MKKVILAALVVLASASLSTANAAPKKDKKKKVQPVVLSTNADSLSYAAGVDATRGLIPYLQQSYKVDTAYMADFVRGYQDAIAQAGTPQGNAYIAGQVIAQMVEQRIIPGTKEELKGTKLALNENIFNKGFEAALSNDTSIFTTKAAADYRKDAMAASGERWLAENAKKTGVKTTKSGLQYKVLIQGNGPVPKASDEVEVIYEGKLVDGTVFDATSNHGTTTDKFGVAHLIKGWTEALEMMPVGSKWEIYIPQELGYGARQAGKIPPYSTLIFTMDLKSIVTPEAKTAEAKTVVKQAAQTSAKGKSNKH